MNAASLGESEWNELLAILLRFSGSLGNGDESRKFSAPAICLYKADYVTWWEGNYFRLWDYRGANKSLLFS